MFATLKANLERIQNNGPSRTADAHFSREMYNVYGVYIHAPFACVDRDVESNARDYVEAGHFDRLSLMRVHETEEGR